MVKKKTKKKNAQDLTLRNLRAWKKRVTLLETQMTALTLRDLRAMKQQILLLETQMAALQVEVHVVLKRLKKWL